MQLGEIRRWAIQIWLEARKCIYVCTNQESDSGNGITFHSQIDALYFGKTERENPSQRSNCHNQQKNGGVFRVRRNTTDIILAKMIAGRVGEYDFIYSKQFLSYFREADLIIDAGANIGLFSRLCTNINHHAEVVSIEPEKDNFQMLKCNLEGKNAICLQKGLWNRNVKLKVYPRDTGEWGFIVKETQGEDFDIDAISMQQVLKISKKDWIDVLKIDIEGSEYEVFDDTAEDWIDKVGLLMIEFHDRIKPWCAFRVFDVMKRHGFQYLIYGETYVFFKEKESD